MEREMRRLGRALLLLLLATSGVLSAQTAANAAVACQNPYSITIPGGYAVINECFQYGTQVRVSGTVTDKDADGRCARVYAKYNNYTGTDYSAKACPEGTKVSFTFPWRAGTNAFVYLQNV